MPNRRTVLAGLGGTMITSGLPGARLALANAPTEARLAIVILRGGLDALHAIPPYRDPRYRALRPSIAVPPPGEEGGGLDLDGYFALHPALKPLHNLYRERELLIVPAATTSYRARSHFDGQNLLENGTGRPYGAADGWLNRALGELHQGDRRLGLSLGHVVPLIARGNAAVRTWAPTRLPRADEDFLSRLDYIYAQDPLFAKALREGRKSQAATAGMMPANEPTRGRRGQFKRMAEAAATLLKTPDGPRIAVFEIGGWDTHFAQVRRLNERLGELADGMSALQAGLTDAWSKTAVIVVSEFGRTAAENGSRGTDHGVGGIALLAGGAVNGGRLAGEWPGLGEGDLYEARDLRPTTDYRGLFKGLLRDHIGLDDAVIEDRVFPASRAIAPAAGLVRRLADNQR